MQNKMHLYSDLPLEQLSTEELERLLRTPDGEEPDVDFIRNAMEVIRSREEQTPAAPKYDVDVAWQEFRSEYQNHADAYMYDSDEDLTKSVTAPIRKPFRIMQRIAIVAAVTALLSVTASSLDIFQAVARWTSETFHFGAPLASSINQVTPEDDPYAHLREAVAVYTDTPVIPTWAPEETQLKNELQIVKRSTCVDIIGTYQFDQGEFTVYIQTYNYPPELDDTTYQKDDEEVQVIDVNGVTHYLFRNLDTCGATWVSGNVKCYIQGDLTTLDLSRMIGSIYKE